MKSFNLLFAFIGGAAAGALIGILLAPEKGCDTREKIISLAKEKGAYATDKIHEFLQSKGIMVHKGEIENLVNSIKAVEDETV